MRCMSSFLAETSSGMEQQENNLNKIRDDIDKEQFQLQLNNFSSQEFNYEDLISFDSSIPLSEGAKAIYKKEGLIYYGDDVRCKL